MFAFFKVSVAGASPETIVFDLNKEKCPQTCDNFMSICNSRATAKRPPTTSGAYASSHEAVVEPTYRGTEFHRIIPQFMIQGGDFTSFDGKGGFAAPTTNDGKPTFPDECFDISHDRDGILSMANRGKNTNGSQFFITLGKSLHLDGKHVAFGRVVRGMECVRRIAQVETDGNGKPVLMQRVVITDCGVGTGDNDSGSSDSSSSISTCSSKSSASLKRTKKKRRRSEKKYKSSSSKKKYRKRSDHSSQRYRDEDDERDYSRRRKKKSKEKASHRHHRKRERGSSREKEDEKSKKRHRKDDERYHKRKRH